MIATRNKIVVLPLIAGVLAGTLGDIAVADSLRLELEKKSFLLYEPVPVGVTLCLDEPLLVNWDDPEEAQKQLRRLPRRLYAELRNSHGGKVYKALVGGISFRAAGQSSKEIPATGLAFFGMPKNPGEEARSIEPGSYTIVVVNKANRMESHGVAVALVAPKGKDAQAAERFCQSLPDGALVVLEQKGDPAAMECFHKLADDYAETVYGKYAVVSLALVRYQETRAEHNIKGGATVWRPVANDLAGVEMLFTGKHPLREKVLYYLTSARVLSGDYASARESLAILKETFPHGKLGSQSDAFEKEITQIEKQGSSDDDTGQ